VFAPQEVQVKVPGEDHCPIGQQIPEPLLLYFPVGQGRGIVVAVPPQYVPDGHGRQEAEELAPGVME